MACEVIVLQVSISRHRDCGPNDYLQERPLLYIRILRRFINIREKSARGDFRNEKVRR